MSQSSILPPPLRERQRHRPRAKKEGLGSRWLSRSEPPPDVFADEPHYLTPAPVAIDLRGLEFAPDPFGASQLGDLDEVEFAEDDVALGLPKRRSWARVGYVAAALALVAGVSLLQLGATRASSTAPPQNASQAAQPVAAEPPPLPELVAAEPDESLPNAADLREEARALLAAQKHEDAIHAATESTKLDPSDASAWLILAAAQMDLGRYADSNASFRSCVTVAKQGPIAECRKFLR